MKLGGLVLAALCGCGRIAFDARDIDAGGAGDAGDASDASDAAITACGDADLVACWQFDGDVEDHSANQVATSASGVAFMAGVEGMAVVHDALSRISVAEAAALDVVEAVTVELWFQLASLPTDPSGVFLFDNDVQYAVNINSGGAITGTVIAVDGVKTVAGVVVAGTGEWHHVALRYGAGENALFFDGALLESNAGGGAISVTGTNGTRIGGDAGAGVTAPLQGAIDEVRVWRIARTDEQICKAAGTC